MSKLIQTLSALALCGSASATILNIPVNITTGTGSTATQGPTSGSPPGGGFATNALNGNLGDFTHTEPSGGVANWWLGDLTTDRSFSNMRIYNRGGGCCPERLRDLTVSVLDASNTVLYTTTGVNAGNALGGPAFLDFSVGPLTTARFIRVERTPIPGDENSHNGAVLSIGEILVFSRPDVMLTSGTDLTYASINAMTVSQSSTLGGFAAGSAVNGATNDFTHTIGTDPNPTWTVNFGETMNLESFNIGNRGDGCCQERLRDITITVRDSFDAVVWTSGLLNAENVLNNPSSLTGVFPTGLQGQSVSISRTPDTDWSGLGAVPGNTDDAGVLAMSEVRIIGSSIPEPSSLLLAPVALAGLLRRRRK